MSSVRCHSGLSGIVLQKDSRRALLAGMTIQTTRQNNVDTTLVILFKMVQHFYKYELPLHYPELCIL